MVNEGETARPEDRTKRFRYTLSLEFPGGQLSPTHDDPPIRLSQRQLEDLERGLDAQGRQYLFSWLLDEQPSGASIASVPSPRPREQADNARLRMKKSAKRSAARALVSVMISDGEIRPSERAFIDNFLRKGSQAPLQPEEVRAWQPAELPIPANPRAVVEVLASLVHLDSQPDRSEWQLVREFARAWRIRDTELAEIEEGFAHRKNQLTTLGRFLDAWRRLTGSRE